MLRIYLDTNLLTHLDDYPSLKEKLLSNSDYLNIVYSSAHIDDLSRGSKPELTLKDLKAIKYYSEDQCLAKYWGEENLRYDIRDPIEFFESFKETSIDLGDTINNLDKECKKLDIENPLDKLNGLNLNIDFDESQNQQNKYFPFRRFKKDSTFRSLFDDIAEIFQQSLTSNSFLKEARTQFDKQLPRIVMGNVEEDVIGYLNQKLPKTVYNKTFDDFVVDSLKLRGKDKSYSKFDWFITRYNTLDIVGYKSDNKSTTSNIVADAFHAFYAAHCDIFLSRDRRLKDKAKVIYEEFGIETLIFSEVEFCEYIDNLIFKIQNATRFANFISDINTLEVQHWFSDIDTKFTIIEHRLKTFFVGYFDYVICAKKDSEGTILTFMKENKTFSNWYYYKELRALVKVFVEMYGYDISDNNEFVDLENEYSEEQIWIGRIWHFEHLLISLSQDKDLGLTLRLETFN